MNRLLSILTIALLISPAQAHHAGELQPLKFEASMQQRNDAGELSTFVMPDYNYSQALLENSCFKTMSFKLLTFVKSESVMGLNSELENSLGLESGSSLVELKLKPTGPTGKRLISLTWNPQPSSSKALNKKTVDILQNEDGTCESDMPFYAYKTLLDEMVTIFESNPTKASYGDQSQGSTSGGSAVNL